MIANFSLKFQWMRKTSCLEDIKNHLRNICHVGWRNDHRVLSQRPESESVGLPCLSDLLSVSLQLYNGNGTALGGCLLQ